MTSEPPTAPWPAQQPPPPPPFDPAFPAPPPPKQRKLGTGAIVGIVVGAVALGCCGLTAIGAVVGGDSKPAAEASPSAEAVADRVVPSVVPTTAAAPTTTAPSPTTVVTTAPPTPPAPTTVVMPNLVGMNAAVAEDKLKKLGLTNIQLGSQDENDTFVILAANWTVTKQSQKKGTKVALDDLVVLTCTKQR